MAELLIMKADKVHDDPAISANHCYKRGDIVQVVPDGYSWSRKERKSTYANCAFFLLRIPGLSVADANKFMDEDRESLTDEQKRDNKPLMLKRRKWRTLLDTMPVSVRSALDDTGEASAKFEDIRTFIENKSTNETA